MFPVILQFLLLLAVPSCIGGRPHSISLRLSSPPSSLLYDPFAQHFLFLPLSSVSDAGVLQALTLSPAPVLAPSALALDIRRRRLLLASPSPSLAAYDLSSPPPHRLIFRSTLPLPLSAAALRPSSIAIDTSTGDSFVTASGDNLIWRVDADGASKVLSVSSAFAGGDGLDGIAYVSKGYLLVTQSSTGKLFKVDPDDGIARRVLMNKNIDGLSDLVIRSEGSVVAISNSSAWILKSDDGWSDAAIYDRIDLGEGRQARGVTVREGRRAYVLHGKEGGEVWNIEEVESDRETEGEWIGALIMLALGLAVFAYWRFQMRQLVSSMNKKIA